MLSISYSLKGIKLFIQYNFSVSLFYCMLLGQNLVEQQTDKKALKLLQKYPEATNDLQI